MVTLRGPWNRHRWRFIRRAIGAFASACTLTLLSACRSIATPAAATAPGTDAGFIVAPTGLSADDGRYFSAAGEFSIAVPSGFTLYVDQRPSVDGVVAPLPDGIALQRRGDPSILVTIRGFEISEGSTVEELLKERDPCAAASPNRDAATIDGTASLLIRDTPCGPAGYSIDAFVREKRGYLIQVERAAAFAEVEALANALLSTFRVAE